MRPKEIVRADKVLFAAFFILNRSDSVLVGINGFAIFR